MMKALLMMLMVLLMVIGAVFAQCPLRPLAPGDHDLTLTYDGRRREFRVHVPRGYVNTRAYALVLAFHGYLQDMDWMDSASGFSDLADDENNFIVVYPQGVANSWNAGSCCGNAVLLQIDDFGFVRELVSHLATLSCIDLKQVFTTGFSNGCFLSQGLICKAPDVFAASACGSGGEILLTDCDRDFDLFNASLNILEIHGTADVVVPYLGNPLLGFPPVQANFAEHVERLNCRNGPRETFSAGVYNCEEYYNCDGNHVVEQCVVTLGSHEWFDALQFSNSEYILDFFGLRPLKGKN
jgi:polyhydroxybutyrate depolymerase